MLSPSYALNLSDSSRETKGTQVRRTTSWSPFSKAERRKCQKERAEVKLRGLRKFPVTEDGASGKRGGRGDGQTDSASQPRCRMGQEAPDSHYRIRQYQRLM